MLCQDERAIRRGLEGTKHNFTSSHKDAIGSLGIVQSIFLAEGVLKIAFEEFDLYVPAGCVAKVAKSDDLSEGLVRTAVVAHPTDASL